MDSLSKFDLKFSGLSLGKHQFEYEIDESFFGNFEHSIVESGKFKVDVTMDKQQNLLGFDFAIKGYLHLICDRCADEFEFPVELNEHLVVKFGDTSDEGIDVITLPHSIDKINIAQPLYEYISLSKPLHCEHPPDSKGRSTCNAQMLKLLDKMQTHQEINQEPDHRWDELLKLKKQNLN